MQAHVTDVRNAQRNSFLRVLACSLLAACGAFPFYTMADEPSPEFDLSMFAISGDFRTNQSPAKWIPQMAAIGIDFNRNCFVHWAALERRPGVWDWGSLDRRIQVMEDNDMAVGGVLLSYPDWAAKSGSGRNRLPVDNLEAWSNYVTEVVRHCKGRVKYWEVWNEPPNFTGKDQTAEDYAKIVVAAYRAAKAVDPDSKIGLAAKSAHINYLEQAIEAGAKDHFDYITLHPYEILGGVVRGLGTEALYMSIVPSTRRMLERVNPEKADVPIIFTELGVNASPPGTRHGMGPDMAGYGLVKAYTMAIAQGVDSINWFEGMDGDSGAMGLLEADGTPRPAYTAMAQMIKHLGQFPKPLDWLLLNDQHYAFVFEGVEGPVLITWAYRHRADRIDFGQEVSIVEPLTGEITRASQYELTEKPIIVLQPPDAWVAQARANADRPFPWEGDYTDARSVSITMDGAESVHRGLHTQATDAVAADVVAYGGSARAGDIPGGAVFMMDPNFIKGINGPVKISVVVRRNEANDEAGFKLNYEAQVRRGYKSAPGWYAIPDNKQWHTVTWVLDDAQFVNMWGYNFALDSNGKKYNKYYIKSITVEKLD